MIEITFKTLIQSYPNLKKVAEFNYLVETRYRMAKALMLVEQQKALYDKLHKDLLKKYGEPIDPINYRIKKEHAQAFNDEMEQLEAVTVKIDIERLLHTNVQDKIESPADIVALAWLINWPELEDVKPLESAPPVDQSNSAQEPVN